MTRAKDISKIVTDADLSGTLDVTGTVTAGGLTVDGLTTASKANDSKQLKLERTGSSVGSSFLGSDTSAALHIFDSASTSVATFYQNQDVAFYEDTGTTPKLFWDASAESLGIGTSSPVSKLHINGADSATGGFRMKNTAGESVEFYYASSSADADFIINRTGSGAADIGLKHTGDVYFTSGNVGIGTSSPDELLTLRNADPTLLIQGDQVSGVHYSEIDFKNQAGTVLGKIGLSYYGGASEFYRNVPTSWSHVWKVNNSEKMRINSNGVISMGNSTSSKTSTGTIEIKGTSASQSIITNTDQSATYINNATLTFNARSGVCIVNNHSTGTVELFAMGGGSVSRFAGTGTTGGSFAYVSPNYVWTNNEGATYTFTHTFIQTRNTV
jgi:hypothetical protein